MPYAEDCSRERCKWIGCKIGSGKCDRKTAVLHPDFDRNGSSFCIFHTKKSGSSKSKPHACKIVKNYNSENRKTGCQDLFCIDSYDAADDHDDRYNGNKRQNAGNFFNLPADDPSQKNAQEYRDQNDLYHRNYHTEEGNFHPCTGKEVYQQRCHQRCGKRGGNGHPD